MSQSEILHRCPSCGASLRERAMFCPECGNSLADSEREQNELAVAASSPGPESGAQPEGATPGAENALAPGQSQTNGVKKSQPAARRKRQNLQRASSMARGAIGDTGKRVEKLQNVSTAMFEEASYDPSLRFVLVALGLFLIFVVLLILSKVMG